MNNYIKYPLTSILIVWSVLLFGQELNPEYKQLMDNPKNIPFAEIQAKADDYFSSHDKGQGSGYKQWKRWEYLAQRHLLPDGTVANAAAQNFLAYQDYMASLESVKGGEDQSKVTNGHWTFLGPTNFTMGSGWNGGVGRVNCIAFHPTNSSIIYIGTPAGGLWKSINGGGTWQCLTDGMPSIGVSGIVIHPANANIIWILTGDGDGGDTFSIGVLKTTNGGGNWFKTGLDWGILSSYRGYKLAMHPTNSNILFAATTIGLYKTIDAGTTWTQVKTGNFQDFEFKPGDPTIMYATAGSSYYRSTDSGDTWTYSNGTTVPTTASRIAIGVSAANSSYVYLFCGPATGFGSFKGLYRSFDSGQTFGLKADTPNLLGYDQAGGDEKSQSGYDLCIAVSPLDIADMLLGGINIWTSYDFGSTFSIKAWWKNDYNTIGYTHADIHAIEFNPLNNYTYVCSDGGVFRSTDFGENWTDLTSGLGNTEWYRIAGTQASVNHIIGGTQDNGSNRFNGTSSMIHMRGADGMDAMIDHSNSAILYTTRQDGYLEKSTNTGSTFTDVTPSGVVGEWVTPLVMNPSNSSIIYGGYSDVMKSTNGGSTWTNTGADGRGAIAIGTSSTSRIYASNSGTMYTSSDAGGTWTTISGTLPWGTITFIAVNPDNSSDVFITYGGYTAGQKVYRSTNAGTTWTNISGSLPNVPVYCIAYEDKNGSPNDALYIGTSIGMFYRSDNTGDWIPFQNGLPTVPVFDLEINYSSAVITAATYGRGLWRSTLFTSCPAAYTLTPANDPSNPNFTGSQFYEASTSITSSRIITGGVGTDVTYKAGGSVILTTGFLAKYGNTFNAILGPCEGTKSPEESLQEMSMPEENKDDE